MLSSLRERWLRLRKVAAKHGVRLVKHHRGKSKAKTRKHHKPKHRKH